MAVCTVTRTSVPVPGMAKRKAAKKAAEEEQDLSLAGLEETIEELEQLVEQLESGDLSLEQAVREFERGIKLTRQCQNVLKEADRKVEILLEAAEEPTPFEPDEG